MDSPFSPEPTQADARYHGTAGELFSLALRMGLLTLITLGIYRFWGKTRVRRFIWSATEMDGTRFEYTGTGLEKFLGFLVAMVLLAIYLAVIQMLLFFFGIALFREPESDAELFGQVFGASVTGLAVVPFLYFALYRARRYKMARTRWRGIRFGMESAAWGYAFRALGYGVLTILSLGLLLPLATFRLEKYMTDRSWFGDAPFVQEGRWQDLYGPMKHLFIGLGIFAVAVGLAVAGDSAFSILGFVIAPFWLALGYVHYSVQSFAYLARHKTLAGNIAFTSRPQTSTVVLTYLVGSLAISVLSAIAFALLGVVLGAPALLDPDPATMPGFAAVALGAVGYVVILVAAGAGALAMITQPILAHYVNTLTVENTAAIGEIAQRAHDEGADAEGFADALDIGGAI